MYYLVASSEQQAIVDTISAFLADKLPVERLRTGRGKAGEHEFTLWKELGEIGALGISAAESEGGAGLTVVEEALAFREFGRFLLSPSVLATVLAGRIAAHHGDHQKAADLQSGKNRASLAIGLAAVEGNHLLFDSKGAASVVVWNEAGAAMFDVKDVEIGEACRSLEQAISVEYATIDHKSKHAWVSRKENPLNLFADILTAAMLAGVSEAVRDMAVAHAKMREQFGRPIGAFQAIKHRCADMAVSAEAAWAQTAMAALKLQGHQPDADFHAASAKLIGAHAALEGARANIQVHGAIGFTAESNAHLFLKRAHFLNQIGGAMSTQRKRIISKREVNLE